MRILVYGAGVIGCNLAADLFSYGKDITLLARGQWADTIEKKGLVIRSAFFFGSKTYRIPVIRELRGEDQYDVIFVVMRCTQFDSVTEILKANISKNIVFVGNNLSTKECVEKLKGKNVMFAFNLAAGHREKDKVVSFTMKKITIGQRKDSPSNEKLIESIFSDTKIKAVYEPNMEDYLLCHAAFVVPVGFACYYCNGDLKKIKNDKAYLNRIIDANIDGYRAIEKAGHKILPDSDQDYNSAKYRRLCYMVYKIMCSTRIGKICASDHAMNASEEMLALNDGLKRFFEETGAQVPDYLRLEEEAISVMNSITGKGSTTGEGKDHE